jgi:hypothetical protein
MHFIESMIKLVIKCINPYAQCLTNLIKSSHAIHIKCPMSIVRKSFQPHNDKPKVSATQNINKKIMTVQVTMEEFSRLQS